jgi:hypothetical protein
MDMKNDEEGLCDLHHKMTSLDLGSGSRKNDEEGLGDLHHKMTSLALGSGSSEVEGSPTPSSLPDLLDEREAALVAGQTALMADHLGESHLTTNEQL